jgi:hypothetical protein
MARQPTTWPVALALATPLVAIIHGATHPHARQPAAIRLTRAGESRDPKGGFTLGRPPS